MSIISDQQLSSNMALSSNFYQYQMFGKNAKHQEPLEKQQDKIEQNVNNNIQNIDYEEYIDYCRENAAAPNVDIGKTLVKKDSDSSTIQPLHIGRALNMYAKANNSNVQGKINSEV